jgi:hypothetical protein
MRAEPFDENNLPAIIDSGHKHVVIAFEIKHDAVAPHDAGVGVARGYIGGLMPIAPWTSWNQESSADLTAFWSLLPRSDSTKPLSILRAIIRTGIHHEFMIACAHNGHNKKRGRRRAFANSLTLPIILGL